MVDGDACLIRHVQQFRQCEDRENSHDTQAESVIPSRFFSTRTRNVVLAGTRLFRHDNLVGILEREVAWDDARPHLVSLTIRNGRPMSPGALPGHSAWPHWLGRWACDQNRGSLAHFGAARDRPVVSWR
jgi:hypothetical protein